MSTSSGSLGDPAPTHGEPRWDAAHRHGPAGKDVDVLTLLDR